MVQKIKKRFRELHPNLTLSNDRLDKLVARWANGVTEETNIDELLGTVVDVELLQDIVSLDDSRRNSKPKPVDEPTPTQTQPSNEEPEWAKALKAEIAQLKSEKITDTKKQTFAEFTKGLHLNAQPMAQAIDITNMDDTALETLKTTLTNASEQFKTSEKNTRPFVGTQTPSKDFKAEDAKEIANLI